MFNPQKQDVVVLVVDCVHRNVMEAVRVVRVAQAIMSLAILQDHMTLHPVTRVVVLVLLLAARLVTPPASMAV